MSAYAPAEPQRGTPSGNALILEHLPLVERIFRVMKRRKLIRMGIEQALADGGFALVLAARRYRPELGTFRKFVSSAIWYALLGGQDGYRGRRRRAVPFSCLPVPEGMAVDDFLPGLAYEQQSTDDGLVGRLLAPLPPTERFVIEQSVVLGEPYPVIARTLGCSKSVVQRHVVRALRRLRGERILTTEDKRRAVHQAATAATLRVLDELDTGGGVADFQLRQRAKISPPVFAKAAHSLRAAGVLEKVVVTLAVGQKPAREYPGHRRARE